MTIAAKVIADSIAKDYPRLTTLQLRYPRFIHAELMTHRVFSRNASSSRAIPVKRLIQDVIDDTAMPIHWGKNQAGMQARKELSPMAKEMAKADWIRARDGVVLVAERMASLKAHKQIINRLLEPFAHINVLVTATNWDNFFALRDHPDAQPEMEALAKAMRKAMNESTPSHLEKGEWHLPYVTEEDKENHDLEDQKRISAARCASVSYKTVDGKDMSIERALEIYEKLADSDPIHASPFEHQAKPWEWPAAEYCRNFTKWAQWRAFIEE